MHFNRKTVRLVILGAVFLLGAYLLYLVRGAMLPFVIALILAYVLNPLIVFLEDYQFSRTSALIVVYVIGICVLLVVFIYGIPIIVRELTDLGRAVPRITVETQQLLYSAYEKYRSIPVPDNVGRILNENIDNIEGVILQGIRTILDGLLGFFSHLFSIILAPILAFYLLKDWDRIGRRAISFFPVKWKEPIITLWEDVDRVLIGFIRGHLLGAVIVGFLTGIGLSIIGMDYIILLSVITGISNIIPYFGAIIGQCLWLFWLFRVNNSCPTSDNCYGSGPADRKQPNFTGHFRGQCWAAPITIIFVLLAGGYLFGILGLLFSVPVAAVLRIIIGYIYSNLVSKNSIKYRRFAWIVTDRGNKTQEIREV